MIIPFRSRYYHKNTQGFSKISKNINGNELSHISQYNQNSDSRHIFWKKSTNPYLIFEKKFSDFNNFEIIFCNINETGDNFYNEKNPKSRKKWKDESIKILQYSAKNLNINYKIHNFENLDICFEKILKQQIQNKMIIILSNFISKNNFNLSKISKINEIIWIKPYHDFEKNPNEESLLLGKIFNKKLKNKYLLEIENLEKFEKNFLAKLKIPLIITTVNIPIDHTLYNFFKYQYE